MGGPGKTSKDLKRHASRRAQERLSIEYDENIYRNACKCIQYYKPFGSCCIVKFLKKQSLNRTLWVISIDGVHVVAAWDKKRKAIATFMPTEWVK